MADEIIFNLDGNSVIAEPGETIWEVAKKQGTTIPHLCHSGKKGYRSDGNCRVLLGVKHILVMYSIYTHVY